VAQRRRRVFVVGCLGDWRSAAAVLFERGGMQGNPAPSRKTGKRVTTYLESSFGGYRQEDVGGTLKASGGVLSGGSETFVGDIVGALDTECGGSKLSHQTMMNGHIIPEKIFFEPNTPDGCLRIFEDVSPTLMAGDTNLSVAYPIQNQATQSTGGGKNRNDDGRGNGFGIGEENDPMFTLTTADRHSVAAFNWQNSASLGMSVDTISPTLDTSKTPAVVHAFKERGGCEGGGKGYLGSDELSFTLSTTQDQSIHILGGEHPNAAIGDNLSPTLTSSMGTGGGHIPLIPRMAVRRLTPMECERLQGFPDGYTDIKHNGKPTPDGPRYKALGNSMAVPVMQWIGQRIQMVEDLK
jgi:DNA (cytosine-5)-methyltransferase 1